MEKPLLFLYLFFNSLVLNAQEIDIKGKVVAEGDVEGIHIINKTANKFTITDVNGTFNIPAKYNDTILVSGIKYRHQEVIVNDFILQSKSLTVYLEEQIYQLDEVLIGKFLTGDLRTDIESTNLKHDVNFYDVGIPGYTGKPKTQSERRLNEAITGGGTIPLNPIINAITGRTKMLKKRIGLEAQDVCMYRAKSEFSEILFGDFEIEEHQILDFFFFASEDPKFLALCKSKNAMDMFEFLVEKLVNYKENQEDGKD